MFVDYFNAFLSLPVHGNRVRYLKDTIIECVLSRAVVKLQHLTVLMYFASMLCTLGSVTGCCNSCRFEIRSVIG